MDSLACGEMQDVPSLSSTDERPRPVECSSRAGPWCSVSAGPISEDGDDQRSTCSPRCAFTALSFAPSHPVPPLLICGSDECDAGGLSLLGTGVDLVLVAFLLLVRLGSDPWSIITGRRSPAPEQQKPSRRHQFPFLQRWRHISWLTRAKRQQPNCHAAPRVLSPRNYCGICLSPR